MKKLFTIAAALVLSAVSVESAVAQTAEYAVQPTKKEIKATVRESYDKVIQHTTNRYPVLLIEEILELYSWYEGLDERTEAYFDKMMSKEEKRAGKLMTEEQREYCSSSIAIIMDEPSFTGDLEIITNVYMDTVYECCVLKENVAGGAWYLMDFMIYLALRGEDPSVVLANWSEDNSRRYELVNEAIDGMTYDGMMLDYFKRWFDEDYSQMSEEELAAAYISHKENAAGYYDESDPMEACRHLFASHIIRNYASQETLAKADAEWKAENPEMAGKYYDAIGDLLK